MYAHLHAIHAMRGDFSAKEVIAPVFVTDPFDSFILKQVKSFIKHSVLAKNQEEGIVEEIPHQSSMPAYFSEIEHGVMVSYKTDTT